MLQFELPRHPLMIAREELVNTDERHKVTRDLGFQNGKWFEHKVEIWPVHDNQFIVQLESNGNIAGLFASFFYHVTTSGIDRVAEGVDEFSKRFNVTEEFYSPHRIYPKLFSYNGEACLFVRSREIAYRYSSMEADITERRRPCRYYVVAVRKDGPHYVGEHRRSLLRRHGIRKIPHDFWVDTGFDARTSLMPTKDVNLSGVALSILNVKNLPEGKVALFKGLDYQVYDFDPLPVVKTCVSQDRSIGLVVHADRENIKMTLMDLG